MAFFKVTLFFLAKLFSKSYLKIRPTDHYQKIKFKLPFRNQGRIQDFQKGGGGMGNLPITQQMMIEGKLWHVVQSPNSMGVRGPQMSLNSTLKCPEKHEQFYTFTCFWKEKYCICPWKLSTNTACRTTCHLQSL